MATQDEWQARNTLQQQLRATGDAGAIALADGLDQHYMLAEKAVLDADVYATARGELQQLNGWTRASEHPEQLMATAPRLGLSEKALLRLLQPDDSGFRAEIYLPDPAVLGPDAKPQLVFKGSSGQVIDDHAPGGLRDTAAEDFGGNNFPQSIGLRTDYYDRAMELSSRLALSGLRFEIGGHSLGAGMASAGAAVSGMPATTWNAAGLHPDTVRRFAQENGLPVYDTRQLVTAYQIEGELLNDGVQDNLAQLGRRPEEEMAGAMRELADIVREVPQAGALVKLAIGQGLPDGQRMPPQAQASLYAFIDRLASTPDVDALLKNLPPAAGQRQPVLAAKTYAVDAHGQPVLGADGRRQIVDRPDVPTLRELTASAGPLLEVARMAAQGAHIGHTRVGPVIGAVARADAGALDMAGDGLRAGTVAYGAAITAGGTLAGAFVTTQVGVGAEVAAAGRQAAAQVEAGTERLAGQIKGGTLSAGGKALHVASGAAGTLGQWIPGLAAQAERLERHADAVDQAGAHATAVGVHRGAEALQDGKEEAAGIRARGTHVSGAFVSVIDGAASVPAATVRMAGTFAADGLENAESMARTIARHDRAAGAALGAALGGAADAMAQSASVPGAIELGASAGRIGKHVAASGHEATERHLMVPTVLPTVDDQVRQHEAQARQLLQQLQRGREKPAVQGETEAGKTSEQALPAARPLTLADPAHAGHGVYQVTLAGAREGLPALAPESQSCVAGALAVALVRDPLFRNAEGIVASRATPGEAEGTHLTAYWRAPNDQNLFMRAEVNVQAAQQVPLEQSSQQVSYAIDQRSQDLAQQRAQQQAGPVIA